MRQLLEGVHGKENRLTVTRQDLIPWRPLALPEDMLTPLADTDPTRERGPLETSQTQDVPPNRAVTLGCPAETLLDPDITKGLPAETNHETITTKGLPVETNHEIISTKGLLVETNHELGTEHHQVTETEDPLTDHSLVHLTDPNHRDIHPETDKVGHPTGQTIRAETALDPLETHTI
jgi:hypothetical protein